MTYYADILLPLALPGAFTYRLPPALCGKAEAGCRVLVSLGKRKFYTGIVVRVHTQPPSPEVELKNVLELVDERPLVLPRQLDFWRWICHYYMCMPGEVMKAALPSGLKLESVTTVLLNADYVDSGTLGPREQQLLELLSPTQGRSIEELSRAVGVANLLPVVKRLVEAGAVCVEEKLARAFKPRTVKHVRLAEAYRSEERLNELLDRLRRTPQQERLLLRYLDLSGWAAARAEGDGGALREVAKRQLASDNGGSDSALASLRRKGVLELYDYEVGRLRVPAAVEALPVRPLSAAQQVAADAITAHFREKEVCLLHGVTSSGKTEIYIQLIRRELEAGRQVLYLLPEIALTTQITTRLGRVFGDRMGVYHSKFPDAERVELWQRQLTDKAFPLILGVRSSLFLPFRRLGLVIVDEEHETSYKQQDPAPRYHARDAAIVLARQYGAKVLLGTATPSLETYYNACRAGKYGYVKLTARYGDVLLPEVVVEDVKELRRKKLMKTPFSPRLTEEVHRALAEGGQVILFHNRRGYAPVIECRSCGWTPHCDCCDVSLTLHQRINKLVCHYCGATYDLPQRCPKCGETELRDIGYGTEKIEAAVEACFPEARVARMDLDTTRSRSAYEKIIDDFQQGETNLLIGTQMVTKGLDFDRVRLVGILNADQMLSVPDFRAYERAYQLMSQVAGRAGRRSHRGLVVLQTRQPGLPVVKQVVEGDYEGMFCQQWVERDMFRYPPVVRIINIYLKHRDERICEAAAYALAQMLRPHFGDGLLGPDRPAVGRVQLLYIRKLMLKVAPELPPAGVRRTLLAARTALLALPDYKAVNLFFDVDPM